MLYHFKIWDLIWYRDGNDRVSLQVYHTDNGIHCRVCHHYLLSYFDWHVLIVIFDPCNERKTYCHNLLENTVLQQEDCNISIKQLLNYCM